MDNPNPSPFDNLNQNYTDFVDNITKNSPAPTPQPNPQGEVKSAFMSGINRIKTGFKQAVGAKNPGDILEAGLKFLGGTAEAIGSPAAPVLEPVNLATTALANHLGSLPWVQNFAQSKAGNVTSRVAGDVGDADAASGLIAGGLGADAVKTGAQNWYADYVENLKNTNAVNDVTPSLEDAKNSPQTIPVDEKGNPTTQENGVATKPRITSGSVQKVNNTFNEFEQAAALRNSPAWNGVSDRESLFGGNTARARFNALQPELKTMNDNLIDELKNSSGRIEPDHFKLEVNDAVNQANKTNLALGSKNPAVSQYLKVFSNTVDDLMPDETGRPDEALKVKQMMDNYYRQLRGSGAFQSGSDSQIRALDAVNRIVRDKITQIVASEATDVDVQGALKKETDLWRASDALQAKADAEQASPSGRFAQRHPTLTGFGRYALRRTIFRGISRP